MKMLKKLAALILAATMYLFCSPPAAVMAAAPAPESRIKKKR